MNSDKKKLGEGDLTKSPSLLGHPRSPSEYVCTKEATFVFIAHSASLFSSTHLFPTAIKGWESREHSGQGLWDTARLLTMGRQEKMESELRQS